MQARSHPPVGERPLDGTRRRLSATFRPFSFEAEPAGDRRWLPVASARAPWRLAERMDRLADRYAGHRDVAAAFLVMRWAGAVVLPLVGAYITEQRVLLAEPATAWVRADERREFDRLAVGQRRVAVTCDDPGAAHPDALVMDPEALMGTLVDLLERLLDPVVVAVRYLAPFGRRGLWGLAADTIGGGALAAARETGRDHRPAWAAANEILDRLAARGLPVHSRPRPLIVSYAGRELPFSLKGTCCLRYKAPDPGDHDDPDFAGRCHSCPLVDDEILQRHYLDNARKRFARIDPT